MTDSISNVILGKEKMEKFFNWIARLGTWVDVTFTYIISVLFINITHLCF